jgi:hypothetical protein
VKTFALPALILLFNYMAFAGEAPKPAPKPDPNTKAMNQLEDANARIQAACRFDPVCLKAYLQNGKYNPAEDLEAAKERQKQLDDALKDPD